ncbi:hypothetical protein E2C01_016267 [Portunus trituberculatus]|uniref:Uncharacterized protein n=1 Tax=Portunus trituberculatus TaxID=210409 RepID=A0A5B7DQ48_PORTR|nr:hypothetical protein [Portunus trituberculatus]
MSVAMARVLRHPREGALYEKARRETNWMLCKKLQKLKMEWLAEKKGNVNFRDLDGKQPDEEDQRMTAGKEEKKLARQVNVKLGCMNVRKGGGD